MTDLFHLIANSSPVSLAILLILLVISVISWSFIFSKSIQLKRVYRQNRHFQYILQNTNDWEELSHKLQYSPDYGPMGQIFLAGQQAETKAFKRFHPNPTEQAQRAMEGAISHEIDQLEHHLNFLATTGSVSPYIGLLGTVWGVMGAFIGLSGEVQNTLSAVAPGIAEALIATAVGLFAAIPAVIAYNAFASRIDKIHNQFERFADELINLMQRRD